VTLVFTSDGIDSRTAAGRMMIEVLGSLAEYERELVRERTALKLQHARESAASSVDPPCSTPTRLALPGG
jgi:DNA invertase Pin-like site-specific DNA recombinase